jgi:uroporphyrinogen-III synthase
MRCIVTRPQAQAQALVAQLRDTGVDAVALPLIEIVPVADPQPLRQAWQDLAACAFVMFVSANAVGRFFDARPPGAAWPAATRAGATGPGTAAALLAAGVPAAAIDAPPGPAFDSDALWSQALAHRDWARRRALIVRGADGRDWLAGRLRAAGAQVAFVAAYERRRPQLDAAAAALLAEACARPHEHLWLFSSSEAVANLGALADGADWRAARALASHPRIEAAARALGFGDVRPAPVEPQALAAEVRSRGEEGRFRGP